MDKLKIRYHLDDHEEIIEEEVKEDWTWTTIEDMLDDWIGTSFDSGYDILERNGETYNYDE